MTYGNAWIVTGIVLNVVDLVILVVQLVKILNSFTKINVFPVVLKDFMEYQLVLTPMELVLLVKMDAKNAQQPQIANCAFLQNIFI